MHFSTISSGRVNAIRRSGLLDRVGGDQFGHLTEHVRLMLGVPAAIISIVDEDKQIFAGHCGLPEPWASLGETPLTHSFCQYVVESEAPLIVENATLHHLVAKNQAIGDLGVMAYLGVPISLSSGELIGALAAIDTKPRVWTERDQKLVESLAVVVEREVSLGLSELKYRRLYEDMQEGYYVASAVRDAEGTLTDVMFEEVNPAFERLTGFAAELVVGATLSDLVPEALEAMLPAYERVFKDGEPVLHANNVSALGDRWFENHMRRIDTDRLASVVNDVTPRKSAEAQQGIVNREMSHRLKNTLSMVQAIAAQTLRPVSERAHVDVFEKRLQALSSAHDVLLNQNRDTAHISDVVAATLERIVPSARLDIKCPDVLIGPKATLSFSLLLHELATNALKYGALSNDTGRVELCWSLEPTQNDQILHLSWTETGGPPAREPDSKGFGSKLIRMGLSGRGGVLLSYLPSGFRATMSAPLSHLQHTE